MIGHDRLGFLQLNSAIQRGVYIPKYYNVEIIDRLRELEQSHDLVQLGDLCTEGHMKVKAGHEVGKMAYGTGPVPFIRTSDISNWEIKNDPKQNVSEEIYEQYASRQDIKAGDLLFVRDGTYLIGTSCLVTDADSKLLYQSHILKMRVAPSSPISSPLLLALLSTPIVRKQIRSKQFTSDIIDTVGNRYEEFILPVPRDLAERAQFADSVARIVRERVALRERLRSVPYWAEGIINSLDGPTPDWEPDELRSEKNLGFVTREGEIRESIYVPRYYDPTIDEELGRLSDTCDIVSLGDLVAQEVLDFRTGIEPGKMAYGTGPVPFIRTSDLSNWELKANPKQTVSEELYEANKHRLDVREDDIFLVRDGTYLVGTSCILTSYDPDLLYAGGLYRIRVKAPQQIDPYLLIALLNTPVVRRQMRAKQFTRDIIDTIGLRVFEVLLPIPKDQARRVEIADAVRDAIERRAKLRNEASQLIIDIEGVGAELEAMEESLELLASS